MESAAHGHWVGTELAARMNGTEISQPPVTTALGALLNHLQTPAKHFQPSNVHFGLMPEPGFRLPKKERKGWYAERGRKDFSAWFGEQNFFQKNEKSC